MDNNIIFNKKFQYENYIYFILDKTLSSYDLEKNEILDI
jgi:hypothetical protein